MSPGIATAVFVAGIFGLFWLDRDREAKTSVALWIPVIWLFIVCSRTVSVWLEMAPPLETASELEGDPIDRLVYSCLLALGLIVLVRRRQLARSLRANGLIVFAFFYCAVSLLWSDFPYVGFKRWTKAVGDLVMVLIVLSDREPVAAFKRLVAVLAYILIPLSVLLVEYYPALGGIYDEQTQQGWVTGVTTNKNTLGVVCLCLGLGTLWRFLAVYQRQEGTGRIRRMIANGVILAMVLWLFKLMDSMTSLSSFMMASALLVAANFRAVVRRPAVVHLLVASMVAVSASIVFLGVHPDALQAMGRNSTLTERTDLWAQLLSQVRNPLFGTGFESFWLGPRLEELWRLNQWRPTEAHNGYLEVYLNLGWMGLALLVAVLAKGYLTVLRALRRDYPAASLWLAYFLVGLVYNYTEAAFFRIQGVAWLFLLFAIVKTPDVSCLKSRTVSAELDSTFWPGQPPAETDQRSNLQQVRHDRVSPDRPNLERIPLLQTCP
jgi:O-antigen ligase